MINKTILFLKNLASTTKSKKENKTYNRFINMLNDIERRDLTDIDKQAIETELATINPEINTDDFKTLKKKLNAFMCFAKKKLNLTSEGHYMSLGMTFGLSIGMALGMCFGIPFSEDKSLGVVFGMNIGMIIGMALGMAIGAYKDQEDKKKDTILNSKAS
ncbi:hypothetical protein [uncultured Lacinutrix sp.]|uniref:hypothetical protein n=1 Tax=uncultured Lacinutrix sp. TaxID=574032 RepID=UPI002629F578|nr:hypothetical protein [uncultured Lacinutrix sp.]